MDENQILMLGQAFNTSKINGNGLGLFMSNQIVRQHNGRIEVDSKVGVGTTVQLFFPRREEQA